MPALARGLLAGAISIVPGVFVALLWKPAPGVAVAGIGALAGFMMGVFRISPKRAASLTLGILAAYNLGAVGDRALERLDEASEDDTPEWSQEVFANWLFPGRIRKRRSWLVLAGLGCGLIAGVIRCWFDSQIIADGGTGFFLPLRGAQDSLFVQAILMSLVSAIWGGGFFGLFASAAYRRPVALGVTTTGFVGLCIGLAGSEHAVTPTYAIGVFLATAGIAVALIVAWAIQPTDDPTESFPE